MSKRSRAARRAARQGGVAHGEAHGVRLHSENGAHPRAGRRQAVGSNMGGGPITAYEAGDPVSQDLGTWFPSLASADADMLPERGIVTARGRDLARNNGWAAGALRRECDAVIGASLRLAYKPNYVALGADAEWADTFAEQIEARWQVFANDLDKYCDAARHDSIPGLFGLLYRHYLADGDALGVLLWLPGRGPWATTLQVVDPDRLSNPNNLFDQDHLRAGVETDKHGAATGYWLRRQHPNDRYGALSIDSMVWDRVARETPWGRPIVVHFFDKDRAGQTRGISRMAPVIEALAMDHKLGRAELQASVLNALLAAFIESPYDAEMVATGLAPGGDDLGKYQEGRAEFHKQRRLSFGGVQISSLFPGEKFTMTSAARPNANFAEFEAAVLRKIASGLGVTYEQLSQDWSKTNYSSARAALIEVWRGFTARRAEFTQAICTPVFAAWLEEELDRGDIAIPDGLPGFHEAKAAWTQCDWRGPARGWVDPTKEAEAAGMRMAFHISTLEDECAEQGKDWREVMRQRAREDRYREKNGLAAPTLPKKASGDPQPTKEDA